MLRGVPDTYKFYKVTWDSKKEEEKILEALWRGLLRADGENRRLEPDHRLLPKTRRSSKRIKPKTRPKQKTQRKKHRKAVFHVVRSDILKQIVHSSRRNKRGQAAKQPRLYVRQKLV